MRAKAGDLAIENLEQLRQVSVLAAERIQSL